jgi:hypothetical protein
VFLSPVPFEIYQYEKQCVRGNETSYIHSSFCMYLFYEIGSLFET